MNSDGIQRFGRLVVLEVLHSSKRRCLCDCGSVVIVAIRDMRSGNTRSCGCLRTELRTKHGFCGTPEYHIWADIVQRCENPKSPEFPNYGGRGIKICERWRQSCGEFVADVGRRPTPNHSIDRFPNNDGNYEPGNCRWALIGEQNLNTRHCRIITYNGLSLPIREWERRLNMKLNTLNARINKLKWDVAKAITQPVQKRETTRHVATTDL